MKLNTIGKALRPAQALLVLGCLVGLHSFPAQACITNPLPITETLPNGTKLVLHFKGDKYFHWYEDEAGFTVLRRDDGYYVYAALAPTGDLVETSARVGVDLPDPALKPGLLPSLEKRQEMASLVLPTPAGARTEPTRVAPLGTVKNLVILARFSDHTDRPLPLPENYDTLFNAVGGDPTYAPTGSVRDVYAEMSYGQMTLQSTVIAWVTLPNTEAYYANGVSGLGTRTHELIRDALALADPMVNFSDFDTDNNGFVDSIAFVHSGYAAEFGGTDVFGTPSSSRIWSHRWSLTTGPYTSAEGVSVSDYHINPGVWGTSGSSIGRVGVICHESGHFFGLPDLYDTDSNDPGEGAGSWCMMANSWGFASNQYYPPHFSPWSKIALGWVTPTEVTTNGMKTIHQVQTNKEIHMITSGFPSGEYLLIENRNRAGYDANMPVSGGLAVWHIDNNAGFNTQGFPGQSGWPGNGNHYRVALLQADGDYGLEQGANRGDGGDIYNANGVSTIGGSTIPNTNSYRGGVIASTGIKLSSISAGGETMTYSLILDEAAESELEVRDGDTELVSGTSQVDFGMVIPGSTAASRVFTVTNSGTLALATSGMAVSSPFAITEGLKASLSPGESDTFTIALAADSDGAYAGNLSFNSNDTDEGTFTVGITGNVTIVHSVFEPFSNFTTLGGLSTSPSSLEGNSFVSTVASSGGFTAQPAGPDRTTFVQHAGSETGSFQHADRFTNLSPDRRAHQMVYFVRFSSGAPGTNTQIGGPIFGDAIKPAYTLNAGFASSGVPVLRLGRWVANTSTTMSIGGGITNASIAPDRWIPVVVQYRAPTADTLNNASIKIWIDPKSIADPQASGASSALGGLANGRPANGIMVPQRLAFGAVATPPVASAPSVSYDRVAVWDWPGDIPLEGDPALLQLAIDWINAFAAPEVTVTHNSGVNIPDGTVSGVDFGTTPFAGSSINKQFHVRNDGNAELITSDLTLPTGYLLVEGLSPTIPIGGFDIFTVQLPSFPAGTFSGTIQFTNNDPDRNPFNFAVTGTVTAPTPTPTPAPTRTPAGGADSDGDGFSNDLELLYGSNPNNATSKPNYGDADSDGKLTMKDALALAIRVDRDGSFADPRLDMNGDRTVTSADARIMYFWSVNAAGHQVLPVN